MNEQPTAETQANDIFLQQLRQNARAIQPDAAFAAAFEQQIMQTAPAPAKPKRPPYRLARSLGAAAAVLLLISAAFVTVPPLRAIAQEIISLLIPAKTNRERRDIKDLTVGRQSFASVQEAEAALGQDFAEPKYLPTGQRVDKTKVPVVLEEAVYDPDTDTLILSYSPSPEQPNADGLVSHVYDNWWMWLNEMPSDVYREMENDPTTQGNVGASAKIENLTLTFQGHEIPAQFVRGGWNIVGGLEDSKIINAGGTVNRAVQWVNDDWRVTLMWEDVGVVYSLHTIRDEVFPMTTDELIRIVEGME